MRQRSPGFTLVELLVVLFIIGILLALLIPAVNSARENGRSLQCKSNLKQLALAVQEFETTHQSLPTYYGAFPPRGSQQVVSGWFVHLMPYLDQVAYYETILSCQPGSDGKTRGFKIAKDQTPSPRPPAGPDPSLYPTPPHYHPDYMPAANTAPSIPGNTVYPATGRTGYFGWHESYYTESEWNALYPSEPWKPRRSVQVHHTDQDWLPDENGNYRGADGLDHPYAAGPWPSPYPGVVNTKTVTYETILVSGGGGSSVGHDYHEEKVVKVETWSGDGTPPVTIYIPKNQWTNKKPLPSGAGYPPGPGYYGFGGHWTTSPSYSGGIVQIHPTGGDTRFSVTKCYSDPSNSGVDSFVSYTPPGRIQAKNESGNWVDQGPVHTNPSDWSLTNYQANFHAFAAQKRVFDTSGNSTVEYLFDMPGSFANVKDGLSNSILFAEGMRECDGTYRFTFWSNHDFQHSHNFGVDWNKRVNTYMFQTGASNTLCNNWTVQGNHGRYINVAMADGSVKSLSNSISRAEKTDPDNPGMNQYPDMHQPEGPDTAAELNDPVAYPHWPLGVWDKLMKPADGEDITEEF